MTYRQVEEVTVTLSGWITEYDMDDGTQVYDWRTQNDSSYEWFHTAEEAREDLLNHY